MNKRQEEEKKSRNNETLRALANFSQIGITMAATVIIGVLIGKYLDGVFGTSPWLLLIFSLLGAGAAIRNLFDTFTKEKDDKKNR